jgi:tetratricopeptide (TPR) repeat protein
VVRKTFQNRMGNKQIVTNANRKGADQDLLQYQLCLILDESEWRVLSDNGKRPIDKDLLMKVMERLQQKSEVSMNTREYEKGLKTTSFAIALLAKHEIDRSIAAKLHLVRSKCYQRSGKLDLALKDCKEAVQLDESNNEAKLLMEECRKANELQLSFDVLSSDIKSKQISGDTTSLAQLLLKRAKILQLQGNSVGSLQDYRDAVRLHPSFLDVEDEAFQSVLKVGDEFQEIISCLFEAGLFDRARRIAEYQSRTRNEEVQQYVWDRLEDEMQKHHLSGIHCYSSLQFVPAIRELSLSLEILQNMRIDPVKAKTGAILYSSRATCFMNIKEFKHALDDCSRAIALNPNHIQAWITKCNCLEVIGDASTFMDAVTEASRTFGHSNAEISELAVKALSTKPAEAADAELISSDNIFS